MTEPEADILGIENRWKTGAVEGLRRFGYIAVPFTFYLLFSVGGFIPASIMDKLHLILAVVMFVLGLPLTAILQVDVLGKRSAEAQGNTCSP